MPYQGDKKSAQGLMKWQKFATRDMKIQKEEIEKERKRSRSLHLQCSFSCYMAVHAFSSVSTDDYLEPLTTSVNILAIKVNTQVLTNL